MDIIEKLLLVVYFGTALLVMVYGLNCYVMIFLFKRGIGPARRYQREIDRKFREMTPPPELPVVTSQIPVYNEFNVVGRVVEAACNMWYPAEKHEIQILDDSTDETVGLVSSLVRQWNEKGFNVRHIRRNHRHGFKAGALAHGLDLAEGELVAVFDADFVPPEDFLMRVVPYFVLEPAIGLVQARWGHLNQRRSLLTRVQSLGIDGHFMVEQSARCMGNLFLNFNGTAGIWRRKAIQDGGGWSWDTLTEDMDLSYRVQLAGWKAMFLPDLVVPAEIPEDVNAFKCQQFRWAKGSIQTAIKLFPDLLSAPVSLFKKVEAFFHLTHYLVHPMMLVLSLLTLPVIRIADFSIGPVLLMVFAMMLIFSLAAPNSLYIISQRYAYRDWRNRIGWLPFLVILGVGIAVSNSKAVWEAAVGRQSDFLRTPKKGDVEIISYRTGIPWTSVFELALGLYCAASLGYYIASGKYLVGYFLALYAAGFLFVGLLSIIHNVAGSS